MEIFKRSSETHGAMLPWVHAVLNAMECVLGGSVIKWRVGWKGCLVFDTFECQTMKRIILVHRKY